MKPKQLTLTAAVQLAAASPKRRPTFTVRVYGGGPISPDRPALDAPIIINLAGVTVRKDRLPVLLDHNQTADAIVGQTTRISISQAGIDVDGEFAGGDVAGTAAARVLAIARDGFEFQASIGMKIEGVHFIADDESVKVNGREFDGPVYVASSGTLYEISLLSVGADDGANVSIAARRKKMEKTKMDFITWLQAAGFDPDELSVADRRELLAMYQREHRPAESNRQSAEAREVQARWGGLTDSQRHDPRVISAYVAALDGSGSVRELEYAVTASGPRQFGQRDDFSSRDAVIDNAPRAGSGAGAIAKPRETLAAAFLMHAGQSSIAEKAFGETIMAAAADLRCRHVLDLAAASCRLNPAVGRVPHDREEMLAASFGPSTYSLPSALGLAGEKVAAEAYSATPATWRSWCGRKSVQSFRAHTAIRPHFKGGSYGELAPGGELHHAAAGEEIYQFSVNTYGRIFDMDRRDLVNDDLGIFTDLMAELGRGGPRKISDLVYKLLLDNPGSFFAEANNNYDDGADTALSIAALTLAVTIMRKQRDADGNVIGLQPKVLLVPPELESTARAIITSTTVSRIDTGDLLTEGNPWKDLAALEVEPRLSDTTFHANASALAWYLLAGPMSPAEVVAFLGGVENPRIEQLDAPSNVLGKRLRGYIDFGVAMADFRGGVMMKGEA